MMAVVANIRGKEFPLCLTVAALDRINEKCGGLKGLPTFLRGDGNGSKAIANTAWLLGVLIKEGEEHRIVEARFSGEKTDRIEVPDSDALSHLLNIAEAKMYYDLVWAAIAESIHQEIEAEHQKNAPNAERR